MIDVICLRRAGDGDAVPLNDIKIIAARRLPVERGDVAARNAQQYDFYLQGWNGDYNDPMTFFELWVTGNGYAKFMGGYSNAEYDALVDQAGSSQDDAERLELFGKAEALLMEEGGVIPLYFNNNQMYIQNYVSGLSTPMFGTEYEFSRVKILKH